MTPTRPRWTTILALLLVPVLVAGGFLWGTWNSDDRLRTVQAAVVNLDEMVEVNGQTMPLGRQLAAELVDTEREQNFTWVLADEQSAREGLASGRYAAVVTIPKEFSAAATSFAKPAAEAVQATIDVRTSPVTGLNETALGQSIAAAATNALNRFLTGEYLKNVYVGFNDMRAGMDELADGTRQLADGAVQLADGTVLSADGAGQLADGLGQASAGSPQLRDGAAQAASGTKQLADGTRQLADGTSEWATGAGTYAAGVGQFADGVQTYADGVATYTGGINGIVTPVRDVLATLPEWGDWLTQAEAVIEDLPERAAAWESEVQALLDDARDFVRRVTGLAADATAVDAAVDAAASRAATLASGKGPACPASLADTPGACEAYAQGVAAAGASVADALRPAATKADALADDSADLAQVGERLLAAIDRLSDLASQMVKWAPVVQQQFAALKASIPEGTPLTQADLLAMLDQLIDGGNQLADGGQQLADGADALAGGATQLASGATGISGGMTQLADGTDELASGLGQLSDGVAQYTGGIDQAAAGAGELADGLGQLGDGARQLSDGTDELADGVADGLDDIPTYTEDERERLSTVVAAPVSTSGLDALVRPGLAWVSLLLIVALWAGALAATTALGKVDPRAALSREPSARLLAGALWPSLAIVAVQALALTGAGAAALRLTAGATASLGVVLVIAGVAFTLVNHALGALLGNPGRLLALGMAVVTAVAATTFAAPAAFASVRALSPLSPALDAVQAAASGSSATLTVLVLVGWALLGLGASAYSVVRTRTVGVDALVGGAR